MERAKLLGGGIVVLTLLLVAAFAAGQLLGADSESPARSTNVVNDTLTKSDDISSGPRTESNAEQAKVSSKPETPRRPARVMELVNDDGSGPVSSRITVVPSPDLPDSEADVGGVFVRRDDNSIFVGTGDVELNLEIEVTQSGAVNPQVSLKHNGPVIEVVITHETDVYREETEVPGEGGRQLKGGDHTVQQVVSPVDSLDELGKNTEVQVWGERRGDRVVADVFVYRIVSPTF